MPCFIDDLANPSWKPYLMIVINRTEDTFYMYLDFATISLLSNSSRDSLTIFATPLKAFFNYVEKRRWVGITKILTL